MVFSNKIKYFQIIDQFRKLNKKAAFDFRKYEGVLIL